MPEEPKDHLDEVFDKYAEPGQCQYCGHEDVPCRPDPFGQRPACKDCTNQIIDGSDED